MTAISTLDSEGAHIDEDSIEFNYSRWLFYYEELLEFLRDQTAEIHNRIGDRDTLRTLAIEYLKKSLTRVGTWEQQLIKIKASLLLVKIYNEDSMVEEREVCFYGAVEIARQYLWDDFHLTPHGEEIIATYLSHIDSTYNRFYTDITGYLIKPILLSIVSESDTRIRERLERVGDTQNYFMDTDSVNDILSKIEYAFGPIRFLVISESSGEILINHWFTRSEIEDLQRTPDSILCATVKIFDKPREYSIIMDCGDRESAHRFEQYQPGHIVRSKIDYIFKPMTDYIIKPMIDYIIRRREQELLLYAADNAHTIDHIETNMEASLERNDYRDFVVHIIWNIDPLKFHESRGNEEVYINDCLMAIDICRSIALPRGRDETFHMENLPQEIDTILWGKIQREVFKKVQSMLSSRNETMNGTGYPFGLRKEDMPMEWRIYSIIRAYEALCLIKLPGQVLRTMNEWGVGGYFDSDILWIFFECLEGGILPKISLKKDSAPPIVSEFRRNRYNSYIRSWHNLIKIAREIEDNYYKFRCEGWDESEKREIIGRVNELKIEFLRMADVRKLLLMSRHGEDDNQSITTEWIRTSENKWGMIKRTQFRIYTSPSTRTQETAEIVCGVARNCEDYLVHVNDWRTSSPCVSCPAIIQEPALRNTRKSEDDGRWLSAAGKLIFGDNIASLKESVERLASSPGEWVIFIVTHGSTYEQMIFLFRNAFSPDEVHYEHTTIGHSKMHEFLLRWGTLISRKDEKNRGILFSAEDYESLTMELDTLTKSLFWDVFHHSNNPYIDPLKWHDLLLDFIDSVAEKSPDKLPIFIKLLEENPLLKDFPGILRTEGVIE